ncbi:hypothetical protein DS909_00130 [Phaeobacter gallaeciensis]|uniref:Uncharacterized protein n=1 Tax=Phaeobacter gallaeciensis TaxID=60890 RepID=A0A366XGX4_9RHOB|nr:hypothetical protein [Phaeobacter gallaeciensis]RBW62880.1 hypothetical protein DS909_00130 [Phaeobacter gallaeciensis]
MPDLSHLEQLVALLGGWPEHFGLEEEQHALAMLSATRRQKVIDEPVFRLVCLWGLHMASHDKLSRKIDEQSFTATKDKYLSGEEQRRAFHENKIMALQRELLATPYARAKNGGSAQTDFLAELGSPSDGQTSGKVTPFKTFQRRGGNG